MPNRSRQKGDRGERALVHLFQDHGFSSERIPLSGSAGGSFTGDITTAFLGKDWRVEVKCRANGFVQLYSWLADHDALIVKADRKVPLLVIPLDKDVLSLARGIEITVKGLWDQSQQRTAPDRHGVHGAGSVA